MAGCYRPLSTCAVQPTVVTSGKKDLQAFFLFLTEKGNHFLHISDMVADD